MPLPLDEFLEKKDLLEKDRMGDDSLSFELLEIESNISKFKNEISVLNDEISKGYSLLLNQYGKSLSAEINELKKKTRSDAFGKHQESLQKVGGGLMLQLRFWSKAEIPRCGILDLR